MEYDVINLTTDADGSVGSAHFTGIKISLSAAPRPGEISEALKGVNVFAPNVTPRLFVVEDFNSGFSIFLRCAATNEWLYELRPV